jgi:Protein of unknown function (DUF664)
MADALEISPEGFIYLMDRVLNGMVAVLNELGDDLVNQAPDLAGTNTPHGIVNHSLAVARWWSSQVAGGREADRDREHEWSDTGPVADLVAKVPAARQAVADAVAAGDWLGPNRGDVPAGYVETPIGTSRGIAVLHVYEELVQHLGQLELTRDILLGRPRA